MRWEHWCLIQRQALLFSGYDMSAWQYSLLKTDDAKAIAAIRKLVDLALHLSTVLELYYINNNHLY
ncbi:hypothetical protein T4B_6882 [Trichinella pseudospiralis]|uniref:Uncharacterized protein n=1 Tax=Trichinella pseudospiralis TaxID=6337 RepID=A0A0V1JVZ7_TRIPS|nr:hypothetical protein T4A_14218 [Trichinella pseudospiralis]KRZ00694.1 hypothetical protein T4B_6882 [Trichinella pseudospiralis]KRZ39132.1 hypothetical protein T4C_1227 [Trichinella pseudospiralis]